MLAIQLGAPKNRYFSRASWSRAAFAPFLITIVALPGSFLHCSAVDVTLNRNINTGAISRIAIFPFSMETRSGASGTMEESLTVELLRMGCNPIDRRHMQRLLKEQALAQTGLIDSNQAVSIGRMAGAHAIVIGTGSLERHQGIDVLRKAFLQVIDVETTSIVLAGSLQTGALLTMEEFAQDVGSHLKGKICQEPPGR